MKRVISGILFLFLSGTLYADAILSDNDSTSELGQVLRLNRNLPDPVTQFNHFELHGPEGFRNDCMCYEYNLVSTDSLRSRQEITDFLNNLIFQYGVIPDMVESPFISDPEFLVEYFRSNPVYKAQVLYKGEPLGGVSWKEYPHLETHGVFRTSDNTLSPQRRGFMFTPDIYNFTDRNSKVKGPKLFRAIKYELNDRLRYHFPFTSDGLNAARAEDYITVSDLEFSSDGGKGEVAYFNGQSSYLDVRDDFSQKLEEISISAWVKPDAVDGSLSLVGKGEVFSAKIFNGHLQFTTIGIKDHDSTEPLVQEGVWSHIAMVYVPGQKLYFYLNGELREEVTAAEINHADHALLIGSNLWGQNYAGYLSDLRIWKRALSDEEVKVVYELVPGQAEGFTSLSWMGIAVIGGFLGLGVVAVRRKRRATDAPKINTPVFSPKGATVSQVRSNFIGLLNGFRIINKSGSDITHKFSPKRTELLVLIILYTLKEDGISSKELSDILWPGFSAQNKKNNRSTQVKEIRKLLEDEVDGRIVFEDKKWRFEASGGLQIDLLQMQELLPGFLSSAKIPSTDVHLAVALARIAGVGKLLPQIEEEWLDPIKADFNFRLLDILTPFLNETNNLTTEEQHDLIEAILVLDPLFDAAIKHKVTLLRSQGKFGSAKKVIENYKKLYHSYYDEPLDVNLLDPVEI